MDDDRKPQIHIKTQECRIRTNHIAYDGPMFRRDGADEEKIIEDVIMEIQESINNPTFAFERTFDGNRYTRMIK